MKPNVAVLSLVLSLILLANFPNLYVANVRAVDQNRATTWSPYGPREQKLTYSFFSDFSIMFNAFAGGQIDITDWPLQSTSDVTFLCGSPDIYCTSPQAELLIFHLDINHRQPFLGVSLQANRTTLPPSIVLPVTTGAGCTTGFGQLTIKLRNQEQGNAAILDPLNKLTIANQPSGSPSATVSDSGGSNPTGTYTFPCILAGNYKITSSIYGTNSPCTTTTPTSCVDIGSSQSITATFQANWNSPSTKQPTQAGVYVGQALAHLLDKPSFVQGLFGSLATYDDEQVSPAQNIPNLFSKTAECSDHPWFNPCNPVSAYNFAADNIGGGSEWWTQGGSAHGVVAGYSGVADLRAACDDFVKSGFTVVNGANATDCGDVALASLGSTPPASTAYPHLSNNGQQILFMIRSSAGRLQFGVIVADTINFLFGTPNNGITFPNQTPQCTVTYNLDGCPLRFPQFLRFVCVFEDTCPWNLYTGGQGLNIIADQFYNNYFSSFASNSCGGQTIRGSFIPNYGSYCDPQLDTYALAGEFSSLLSSSTQFFARAALEGALAGLAVPVFTFVDQFAENNGWNFQQCNGSTCTNTQSSIVNTLGRGTIASGAYFSLLNARQVPGYNPCSVPVAACAGFAPGGGDPNLIRRGFSQDTTNLSPFTGITAWDFDILGEIYDSMLQANPLTGGTDGQVVDWQTTSHGSTFNPGEVGCNSFNGCLTGVTTQLWHLRNDLYFQDGTPVTAADVAYTIIAYRDVPSASFYPNVANVVSAMGLDCGLGQPCKTLQVKLQGQSALSELNIGTLPIIPKHLWAPICGDPPVNGGTCADPAFDPMAQGVMIGDGPWRCVVPAGYPNAGHVGGSCAVNVDGTLGGQALTSGAKLFLTRYDGFVRCCSDSTSSDLYRVGYADRFHSGKVDFFDLASVAAAVGKPDPYWCDPNIVCMSGTVGLFNLALVNNLQDHGTLPNWRTFTGVDPQIDPFRCPAAGC